MDEQLALSVPFPVSVEGLIAMLVGSSPHPIQLSLADLYFSLELWRALVLHCPHHIQLYVDDDPNGIETLIESLQSDEGRNLSRIGVEVHELVTDMRTDSLRRTLKTTKKLKDLTIEFVLNDIGPTEREEACLVPFFLAIEENYGLERLEVDFTLDTLSNKTWSMLWNLVATHSTLRSLAMDWKRQNTTTRLDVVPTLADAMLGAARSNQFLCDLHVESMLPDLSQEANQQSQAILMTNRLQVQMVHNLVRTRS